MAEPGEESEVIYTDGKAEAAKEREDALASRTPNKEKELIYEKLIDSKVKDIKKEVCWAVSIAETVEAHYNQQQGETKATRLKLSPQFLINYVEGQTDYVTHFKRSTELIVGEGLPLEKKCPYGGGKLVKRSKSIKGRRVGMNHAVELTDELNEDEVIRILDDINGPVTAVINVDGAFLRLQPNEIYRGTNETRLHAVVIIGYGGIGDNRFWSIRNCHGIKWCNKGIGRISRKIKLQRLWYPVGVS